MKNLAVGSKKMKGELVLISTSLLAVLLMGSGSVMAAGVNNSPSPDVTHRTLTSPNPGDSGLFGSALAISGTTLVVGAPEENPNGQSSAGRVYIFNAKTGALSHTLVSPNVQLDGFFGEAVAITGTTLAVGASETVSGLTGAGRVYIFNAGTGALVRTLTSPNQQTYGGFGDSVALSSTTLVIGADGETANGLASAGHVYVYNSGTGALLLTLTSPSAQADGSFGSPLAFSGSTLAIGAEMESADGFDQAGHAYVFNVGTGALLYSLTSPNAQAYGNFGGSIAISGTTLIVGARFEEAGGQGEAGSAYVFNPSTGALARTLTSPNLISGGQFGSSVAVSGNTLVVGARSENVGTRTSAGRAYTYNAGTGALLSTLTSTNAQRNGFFGSPLAIRGSIIVVAAPYEKVSGFTWAGHVYIY